MAQVLEIDPEKLRQWWLNSRIERNLYIDPSLGEKLRIYCKENLGKVFSKETIDRAIYEADKFHDTAILNPHAEVISVLKTLREKRIKIGVLSNCDEHEIRFWPESPLPHLVDAVAFSVEINLMKPDPAAYQYILTKLGDVRPSDAMFVGDGESEEITGAKFVGFGKVLFMKQFVAHTGFHSREKLEEFEREADAKLDNIQELIEHI
jgi:putative hydrolase of the HAD superfamily